MSAHHDGLRTSILIATAALALGCAESHGVTPDAGAPRDGRAVVPIADAGPLPCEERSLRIDFVPTARAQLAVWIEGPGERFRTGR